MLASVPTLFINCELLEQQSRIANLEEIVEESTKKDRDLKNIISVTKVNSKVYKPFIYKEAISDLVYAK